MKSYTLRPLAEQEQAAYDGFTHIAFFRPGDIPAGLANAASTTFTLGSIPAGGSVLAEVDLRTAFKNSADAAFNDSQITIGDGTTANSILTASQINENGTEITVKRGSLTAVFTAADSIILTLASMTGKSSSNLNTGLLVILVKIIDPVRIATIKAA